MNSFAYHFVFAHSSWLVQVSRHMQHRSFLIYRLSSLQSLDGVLVTTEERQNAEITFGEHFVSLVSHMTLMYNYWLIMISKDS